MNTRPSVSTRRSGAGLALALLALVGSPARSASGAPDFPLSFDAEHIRLHIVGDSLEVRGTYWLSCVESTDETTPLFYPFPHDSLMGGARMVSVKLVRTPGDSIPIFTETAPTGTGARWWIPPCAASDTLRLESVYRQALRDRYARYIVTTTRAWGHPLREARFEIHLPPGTEPREFSFPSVKKESGAEVWYAYDALDFLPDHDIEVRWR